MAVLQRFRSKALLSNQKNMHDNSIDVFFYWSLHLDVFDNFGQVSDKYVLKH